MENWLIIVFALCIAAILKAFFNLVFSSRKLTHSLPPSPSAYVLIVKYLLLRKSYLGFEPILRDLHARFGPIVSLGSRHAIFVSDHSLAHQALVQNGVVFADRPVAGITRRIISNNQRTIGSAAYGPLWRVLRRNLMSKILHPSRAKSYSHARKWVLQVLKQQLMNGESGVPVVNHLRYAMFCLLVLMCFGDKLDEHQIMKIEDVQRCLLLNFEKFNILNFCPPVTRILFYKKWERLREICKNQADVLIPLIRARKKVKEEKAIKNEDEQTLSYVDTLLDLELPEEKRKLTEEEIISLCSEFLNGGTDTTSTTLQWIMANLVKYQPIQEKLYTEMKSVVGDGGKEVQQDDLQKMPYLKAVILEGVRRHPPTHFLLPHRVTEDFVLNNFLVPREGTVYFSIADMGRDPKVWEDPMVFKPERFLGDEGFDLTGSKEIKMVPFGAGRRICPGMGLAMLHLEYFVANLIWSFEWKPVDRDDVDLSEKQEFTIVMKTPLLAQIHPRL